MMFGIHVLTGMVRELVDAIYSGRTRQVKALLAHGANDKEFVHGWTPLIWAAWDGRLAEARLLLAHDPRVVNLRDGFHGRTALMWVHDDEKMVRELLKHGAEVNAVDDCGQTALILAACRNDVVAARILLEHHAATDVRDNQNKTALDYARAAGYRDMMRLLAAADSTDSKRK